MGTKHLAVNNKILFKLNFSKYSYFENHHSSNFFKHGLLDIVYAYSLLSPLAFFLCPFFTQ